MPNLNDIYKPNYTLDKGSGYYPEANMHVQYTEALGVDKKDMFSVIDTWYDYPINTVAYNDIPKAKLINNCIILPPGTYDTSLFGYIWKSWRAAVRLVKILPSEEVLAVKGTYCSPNSAVVGSFNTYARFTLRETSVLKVQIKANTIHATSGTVIQVTGGRYWDSIVETECHMDLMITRHGHINKLEPIKVTSNFPNNVSNYGETAGYIQGLQYRVQPDLYDTPMLYISPGRCISDDQTTHMVLQEPIVHAILYRNSINTAYVQEDRYEHFYDVYLISDDSGTIVDVITVHHGFDPLNYMPEGFTKKRWIGFIPYIYDSYGYITEIKYTEYPSPSGNIITFQTPLLILRGTANTLDDEHKFFEIASIPPQAEEVNVCVYKPLNGLRFDYNIHDITSINWTVGQPTWPFSPTHISIRASYYITEYTKWVHVWNINNSGQEIDPSLILKRIDSVGYDTSDWGIGCKQVKIIR